MRRRVVVTGIGIVSPLGIGIEPFWKSTLQGTIAVGPLTAFDVSTYGCKIAAQIDDFDPSDYMEPRRVRWTDRFAQFAVCAAKLAVDDAGFRLEGLRHDAGVYIGSALGGVAFADGQHDDFRARGLRGIRPLLATSVFGGSATSNVALEVGFCGPNVANANSCASGAVAIGEAFRAIARGEVRVALAGGVEAPLSPLVFGAFTVIRAMSTRNDDPRSASRPFDRDRDGFVMAEGAAMLLLERYEEAVSRAAPIYGEIAGFGLTNDAYHMTAPLPDGECAKRAMLASMSEARVAPSEVELINAHGSSTPLNDKTETLAIKRAFGEAAARIPVTATKGQHGHALGATGAWEAAHALLSIRDRCTPKVVNLEHPDPECDLLFVRELNRHAPQIVVSNSSGFGGINAALTFRGVAA